MRDVPFKQMAKISNQLYIASFIILFAISTIILLIASRSSAPLLAWVGYLDVGLVVLIAFTGFAIHQRDKNIRRYDISYQVAIYLFPLLLVGMWIDRNSLDFNILLPGVTWRTYFFLSILPHALSLWRGDQRQ